MTTTPTPQRPWTAGLWMCAAKPSSIVGWPVVAPPHGRIICNLAYVSPSASKSADPEVKAFFAEVAANGRLIAAAPAMFEAGAPLLEALSRREGKATTVDPWHDDDHVLIRVGDLRTLRAAMAAALPPEGDA